MPSQLNGKQTFSVNLNTDCSGWAILAGVVLPVLSNMHHPSTVILKLLFHFDQTSQKGFLCATLPNLFNWSGWLHKWVTGLILSFKKSNFHESFCVSQMAERFPIWYIRSCVFRVNIGCGPAEERVLLTGLHAVADIFCECCKTTLGWKYVSMLFFERECLSPLGTGKPSFCMHKCNSKSIVRTMGLSITGCYHAKCCTWVSPHA